MAGTLDNLRMDYVGRLESFEQDWAALCSKLGLSVVDCRLNAAIGAHQSTVDGRTWTPVNMRALENVPVLQALCLLLLTDFSCFGWRSRNDRPRLWTPLWPKLTKNF